MDISKHHNLSCSFAFVAILYGTEAGNAVWMQQFAMFTVHLKRFHVFSLYWFYTTKWLDGIFTSFKVFG
jgi:hypothetical protein